MLQFALVEGQTQAHRNGLNNGEQKEER